MKDELQKLRASSEFMRLILDIGEEMMLSGGEVSRVEDTMSRILRAYGFSEINVYSIPAQIQVTAITPSGRTLTQMRRLHSSGGNNLTRVELLNDLSRRACAHPCSLLSIRSQFEQIRAQRPSRAASLFSAYVGTILGAGAFACFFGGTLPDAGVAAILACIITFIDRRFQHRGEGQLLYYFLVSILTGLAACGINYLGSAAGLSMNLDKILIGCVMVTIPGVAITYAVRDMLLGNIITGLLRFANSLLVAASIASGYVLALILTRAL